MAITIRTQLTELLPLSLSRFGRGLLLRITVLAIAACVGACGGDTAEEKPRKSKNKDRGSASVKIDDVAWEATSCSARLK